MRNSFILYSDMADVFLDMPDTEAGQLIKAIFQYQAGGEVTLPANLKYVFPLIRAQLNRDAEKWKKITEVRAAVGARGLASRWERKANDGKNSKCQQNVANIAVNVNDNVNDNVNVDDNVISNKKKNIKKKTLEERQNDFKDEVKSFADYFPETMLRDFYLYWSEPDQATGTKMKKEFQKTWRTRSRLIIWQKNSANQKQS